MNLIFLLLLVQADINNKIDFDLYYNFSVEYYNTNDTLSQYKDFINRFYITPTLKIYGLPINFNFSVESYEGNFIGKFQELNLKFSPYELKDKVNIFLIPLFMFSDIKIGKFYPDYSDLTLKGINSEGFSFSYKLFFLNISYARGTLQSKVSFIDTQKIFYKRKFDFFRIGIGNREKSNLYISYGYFYDTGFTEYDTLNPPSENRLVSTSWRFNIRKFSNEGEVSLSVTTPDIFAGRLESEEVPGFILKIFKPRTTSYADIAFVNTSEFSLEDFKVGLKVRYIGPGYESFGIYNLQKDVFNLNFYTQKFFFKRVFNVKFFYDKKFDNLENIKIVRTDVNTFGGAISILYPRLPYLNFSFLNSKTSSMIKTDLFSFSFSSGYSYFFNKVSLSTSFNFSYQKENFEGFYYYTSGINQSINFKNSGLNIGVDFANTQGVTQERIMRSFLSIFLNVWKFSFTMGYTYEKSTDIRNNLFFSVSPLFKIFKFDLYFRYSTVKEIREFVLRFKIFGKYL